jgi:hypothetical protein
VLVIDGPETRTIVDVEVPHMTLRRTEQAID